MKKILFIFIIFISSLFANTINIDNSSSKEILTSSQIFIDTSKALTIKDISKLGLGINYDYKNLEITIMAPMRMTKKNSLSIGERAQPPLINYVSPKDISGYINFYNSQNFYTDSMHV